MSSCDYVIRGIVVGSSLEMGQLTTYFCLKDLPELNKYYKKRTASAMQSWQNKSWCSCGGGGNGQSLGASSMAHTPFVHDDGEIYVNVIVTEHWNTSSSDFSIYSDGDECNCRSITRNKHKVTTSYERKWVLIDGVMTETSPSETNKITCKKSYKTYDSCSGEEGGWEYPGPEVEGDCLSDAAAAFFEEINPLCSSDTQWVSHEIEGECSSYPTTRNRDDSKEEFTKQDVYNLVLESVNKKMTNKASLPDTPSEAKWTDIGVGCGTHITFFNKETPINYGAWIQKIDLEVIHKSLLDPKKIDTYTSEPESGMSGTPDIISFYDVETGELLKEIDFKINGGKARIGIISNLDEDLAPAEPGQERSIRVVLGSKPIIEED